jgi:hypothetical protein
VYQPQESWEFNTLNIYNYNKPGPLDLFYNFVRLSHHTLPGDIVEAGVFNGRTLLATALLLRELNSSKTVYGYDTFEGFPNSHFAEDNVSNSFFDQKLIDRMAKLKLIKELDITNSNSSEISHMNISSSGDFRKADLAKLYRKIEFLGLKNIKIIKGNFSETMSKSNTFKGDIFASFLDCDLYESYKTCLDFLWPKTIKGGIFYLDEYYSLKFPGAKIAVDEFLIDKKFQIINFSGKCDDDFARNVLVKLG